MKVNKRMPLFVAAMILFSNILALVLRYFSTYRVNLSAFSEISELFTTLTETALPLIAAAAMLAVYARASSYKAPFTHAALYSLAWLITTFAEYFITHLYSGYTLPGALLLSLLWGILMTVAMYAELTVLFFIIIFAARIFASRRLGKTLELTEQVSKDRPFDFGDPLAVGIFGAALALFFRNLGMEIASTVSYIIGCAGIYTAGEIFYLIFRYIFILGALLLSHLLAFRIKNLFVFTSTAQEK